MQRARAWHAVTAAVAIFALVFQLVLVIQGGVVLDETKRFGLGERLWHFVSYFTVQSNILVAAVAVLLARDPAADGRGFRALRLAALLGISVADIDRKIARGETQTERVRGDIPVYLAYFTAWPDAQGNVRYYKDIYERDAHLARAITRTSALRSAP